MSKARSHVWQALNSPFGLWCLSSIILAGITTGWTLFHSWLQDRKENRDKRIALKYELRIRATDFLEDCEKSQSIAELWWHFYQFEGAQAHLTQFSSATMDELVFQYGLLPEPQDAVTVKAIDDATTDLYSLFSNSGNLECVKREVRRILNSEVIQSANDDVKGNGKLINGGRNQHQIHPPQKNPCP